jgi:glycosyltransferase involved in cell wall biosynthesis
MQVLQLGPYAPPHGGIQTNLAAIRQALVNRGIPCPVIAITRSENATEEPDVFRPANAFQLFKLLVSLRYDVVHLHFGGTLTTRLIALAMLCTLMPRSKSVLTFHSGGYPSSEKGRSARPGTVRGFVFRRLDRIIAVNEEIALMFRKFGVDPQRIRIISPHIITPPTNEISLPQSFQAFQQTHEPLLTTVSWLEEAYDLPSQIDALGLVRERFPRAGLVIVGSGNLEHEIRDSIKSKSYAEAILLTGDVEHSVAMRMMSVSDLFLRTTLHDGDSISVREALYLGIPVIATDNSMRPDGVVLIPASDPIALQQAIENCLMNDAAQISSGENGEENIEAVLNLYKELAQDINA